MPRLPDRADYVIIGAGIHGLSTSMHLAQKLKSLGKTVGAGGVRIVVLDKTGVGAGASGIACGVVRNNYYQPAMRELMAQCVEVWESDAEAYSYHPVGYMQISPEVMRAQVGTIYEQQKAIGYESTFIEGEADSLRYMQGLLHDWQAKNISVTVEMAANRLTVRLATDRPGRFAWPIYGTPDESIRYILPYGEGMLISPREPVWQSRL